MLQLHLILLLFLQVLPVFSNTEKVIFVGPSSLKIPVQHPTLEDLQLEALSPHHASLRTRIQAQFPSAESIYGQHSWYLLHGLTEGQRYEVRICWAATVRLLVLLPTKLILAATDFFSAGRLRDHSGFQYPRADHLLGSVLGNSATQI